jgi:hypothetical protein
LKKSKYAPEGDAAFDKMLDKHLEEIADAVRHSGVAADIAAVILGGGYGRGEGGVLKTSGGRKKLYNDLDFFVIAENLSHIKLKKVDKVMASIGDDFSRKLEIDVDFGPAKNLRQLAKTPFTMMWQELREGHIVIYGDKYIPDILPDYDLHDLPRSEGLRLLLNRGAGLLFARQRLGQENLRVEDRDFIGRNLNKTVLACGDVFLLLRKKYCLSVRERLALLEKLDLELAKPYRRAVQFKFLPEIYSIEELHVLLKDVMDLFEKQCLHFFSICYGIAISNQQELNVALKQKDPFLQDSGGKELVKNFLDNLMCSQQLEHNLLFSTASPRLKLLRFLLGLLFEHYHHSSYTNSVEEKKFLMCWNKLN